MKKVVKRVVPIILSCVVLVATFLVSASAETYTEFYSLHGKDNFANKITVSGDMKLQDDKYTVNSIVRSPDISGYGKGQFTFNIPQPFTMEKGKQYKISYSIHFSGVRSNINVFTRLNTGYDVATNNYVLDNESVVVTQTYTAGKTMTITNLTFAITYNATSSTSTVYYADYYLDSVSFGSVWEPAKPVPTGNGDKLQSEVDKQSNLQGEIASQIDKDSVNNVLNEADQIFLDDNILYSSGILNGLLNRFFDVSPEIKTLTFFGLIFGLTLFVIGISLSKGRGGK